MEQGKELDEGTSWSRIENRHGVCHGAWYPAAIPLNCLWLHYFLSRLTGRSLSSGGWRVRLWTDESAFRVCLVPEHFDLPPVVHDWVNKGLGMFSRGCATGHRPIQDPVPLIENSRASCPGGRFFLVSPSK